MFISHIVAGEVAAPGLFAIAIVPGEPATLVYRAVAGIVIDPMVHEP
jgi:hypothetical protein